MPASARPPRTMPSASRDTTSALTSPSTMSQISRICSSMGLPSRAISDGLVVTPSTIPQAAPAFRSSRLAVSRKNFTRYAPEFIGNYSRLEDSPPAAGEFDKANHGVDTAPEIRQVKLLVGRVQVVVGQSETHQHAGDTQVLVE